MPSLQHLKMGALKKLLSIGRRRRRSQLQAQGPKGAAFGDRHAPPSMEPPPPPPLQAACSPQRPTWRCFTYEEISRATNGFHPDNLVGRGGYAEVYRGVLADGRVVAVKRLTRALTDEQKEKEFLTELGTVGHARHPNVSTLLGCSVDGDLHLVFEFSSHGSVSSLLHGEEPAQKNESWVALFYPHLCIERKAEVVSVRVFLLPRGVLLLFCRGGFAGGDVEAPAQGRRGNCPGPALSAQRLPEKDHPQGHQGLQHPPNGGFRTPDLGLRTGEVAAVGVDAPRRRPHRGDLRVPGAGVLHARRRRREDRRIRVRRPPAGAHLRAETRRRIPPESAQLGQTPPEQRRRGGAGGSEAGGRLRRRAAAQAGVCCVSLCQSCCKLASVHE